MSIPISSWLPAGITPNGQEVRTHPRPQADERSIGPAGDGTRPAAAAEERHAVDARASLWSMLSGEERAYYLSQSGPVTYGPRATGAASGGENRMGSHLDVKG